MRLPELYGINTALAVVVLLTLASFVVALTFLVAAGRLRRANSRKAEMWARLEQHLGSTVESIAQGQATPDALHSRIRPADRVVLLDFLYKALMHERRPSRKDLYRELARPYLPLLEEKSKWGDTWQRARAVRTLAELAEYEGRDHIIAALDDPAPHVAMTAARVYAQLALGPVDPLLERIERYRNWDRRLLRSVLTSFGPMAGPALHAHLGNRTASPHVRAVCADALAILEYERAGDVAAEVLADETDVDLLAATLRLLRAPGTAAQRAVVRRLCESPNEIVRGQAVACLGRIGEAADCALAERVAADASPWVSRSARLALSELTAVYPAEWSGAVAVEGRG